MLFRSDEQVLLVQGKEEHLEVLRQGWARRSLKPPSGFHIKCLGTCRGATGRDGTPPRGDPAAGAVPAYSPARCVCAAGSWSGTRI